MAVVHAKTLGVRHRASRKRPQFWSIVGHVLLILLVSAMLIGLFVYGIDMPKLRVQRVLFEGVHYLTEDDILNAAGISSASRIIFMDKAGIEERVEKLPFVKQCEVRTSYPGTVLMRISERKPMASVMVSNHVFEVDREQVVLRRLSPFMPHYGPLITNLPALTTLKPGMVIENKTLEKALELWEVFTAFPLSKELTLSELSAEDEDTLRMFFEELPYEIRWGRGNYEMQAKRLEILWRDKQGKLPCRQYLDLRFDADMVCK